MIIDTSKKLIDERGDLLIKISDKKDLINHIHVK